MVGKKNLTTVENFRESAELFNMVTFFKKSVHRVLAYLQMVGTGVFGQPT